MRILRTGRLSFIVMAASALLLILSGCAGPKQEKTVAFWVVSGTNRGESFSRNSLGGYDAGGEAVVKTSLPRYHISSLARDDQGRLWLGQAWNDAKSSNLLLIWDDDELIEKVEVGMQPEAGIIPFAGEMVAGCTEDGMGFSLWSVNPAPSRAGSCRRRQGQGISSSSPPSPPTKITWSPPPSRLWTPNSSHSASGGLTRV